MAHDQTFKSAIPGSSLAHHKLGELPHERPPKYTDPNEALNYFWKQFHRPEILKQIWQLLEKGATAFAIARAVLYKAASTGIIQMNLGVSIYATVKSMIVAIGQSKGINVKQNPKVKDKIKDNLIHDHINTHFKDRQGPVPPSALTMMKVPKPEDLDKSGDFMKKLMPVQKQQQPQAALLNAANTGV